MTKNQADPRPCQWYKGDRLTISYFIRYVFIYCNNYGLFVTRLRGFRLGYHRRVIRGKIFDEISGAEDGEGRDEL